MHRLIEIKLEVDFVSKCSSDAVVFFFVLGVCSGELNVKLSIVSYKCMEKINVYMQDFIIHIQCSQRSRMFGKQTNAFGRTIKTKFILIFVFIIPHNYKCYQ